MTGLLQFLAPILIRWGLGFLVPDHKARAARLDERNKILEAANENRERQRKARMEADRDARRGDAVKRLFRDYKRD